MANLCSFSMCVNGTHDNIEKFYNAMSQNGNMYMGRGAEADIKYEDEECKAFIDGWCKWSIQSALVDNAISMRTEPNIWYWGDGVDVSTLEFITLWEACERWNLEIEVYSEEPGCCFQEHYMYVDGEMSCDCVEQNEYCLDDYKSKEEAEQDLSINITDEEWNDGGFINRGGFGEWEFQI